MKRFFYSVLLFSTAIAMTMAQEKEKNKIISFNYIMVPSSGDAFWTQYSIDGVYGVALVQGHEVGIMAAYTNTNYSFFDTVADLNSIGFEEIHTIKAGAYYQIDFSESIGLNIDFSPIISSSLGTSVQNDDLQYSGNFTFTKGWIQKDRDVRVTCGLGYGTLFGKPDVYPILTLIGNIGNCRYNLGFPETSVTYKIGLRHDFNVSGKMKGSYANISNAINVGSIISIANTKLEYRAIDVGVQHTYRLQPNLISLVRAGYLFQNHLKLTDQNGGKLNNFNINDSLYITMGLSLNLNY